MCVEQNLGVCLKQGFCSTLSPAIAFWGSVLLSMQRAVQVKLQRLNSRQRRRGQQLCPGPLHRWERVDRNCDGPYSKRSGQLQLSSRFPRHAQPGRGHRLWVHVFTHGTPFCRLRQEIEAPLQRVPFTQGSCFISGRYTRLLCPTILIVRRSQQRSSSPTTLC